MVTVVFNPGDTSASKYSALSQYDYGQVLRIQGLNLPAAVEIDFALQPNGGTSVPRIGITKDGVTDVVIPDSMLENNDSTKDYSIYAFVFLTDATSGQTEYRITLGVTARPKPEVPGGGDNPDAFHEAVQAVREAAEQAAESEKQAEGWAHGREDLPERAKDNARYYAGQAQEDSRKTAEDRKEVERLVESVSGIDEQVAKVEELSKNAQEAATRAETSAEQGEIHKQAAENASTAAQTAAGKTAEDRAAVQKAKEAVEELSTQVQENKDSVDKTAQEFILTAQQALADVNNAGQTQTDRVQTAGETAVRDIQTAQRTATGAIETAKTEAVKTVQTEGATQTGKVTAEGEKQVQAVQVAAQEIIADREQIQTNKTDIADLRQSKAGAIVETAKGSVVQIADSAEAFMEEFKIFGKSEQITTTGAQLFDESQIEQNDSRGFKYLNLAVGEGNFTLSSNIPKSPTDQSAYIMLVSGNVKVLGSEITSNSNGVYSGRSRTFPSKDGYMTIAYRNDSNTNNLVTFNKYWYMLNAGDTAKPYEPFTGGKPSPSPDYPQEIKNNAENGEINANVITGNLFPIDKFKKYEINNSAKQVALNGDRILFTGKGNTGKEDIAFFMNKAEDKLSLSPGEYTLSFKSNKPYGETNGENTVEMFLVVEKQNGTVVSRSTGSTGRQKVVIEKGDKLYFRFDINNNSMSAEFYDIMFNLGSTSLPYEPHVEQSLILQTPNGLPGIPVSSGGNYTDSTGQQWVCDEIDLERGKYVQRIGVETKSGGWTLKETPDIPGRYLQHNITANKYKSNNDISLCNIALYSSWGRPQPKKFSFVFIDKRIYIAPPKDMQITADELNAILNNLDYPVAIAGQLNTPIETDLTPEEIKAYKQLHTYYPTTVVTNSANADMQLDYVADTQLYIDKKIKEHVTANIQKTASLLSLMPLETQATMIENDTNNILENMEVQNHE
ncbi:MAG: hypothetical protein ACLTVN_03640 [Blautia hansenii]